MDRRHDVARTRRDELRHVEDGLVDSPGVAVIAADGPVQQPFEREAERVDRPLAIAIAEEDRRAVPVLGQNFRADALVHRARRTPQRKRKAAKVSLDRLRSRCARDDLHSAERGKSRQKAALIERKVKSGAVFHLRAQRVPSRCRHEAALLDGRHEVGLRVLESSVGRLPVWHDPGLTRKNARRVNHRLVRHNEHGVGPCLRKSRLNGGKAGERGGCAGGRIGRTVAPEEAKLKAGLRPFIWRARLVVLVECAPPDHCTDVGGPAVPKRPAQILRALFGRRYLGIADAMLLVERRLTAHRLHCGVARCDKESVTD